MKFEMGDLIVIEQNTVPVMASIVGFHPTNRPNQYIVQQVYKTWPDYYSIDSIDANNRHADDTDIVKMLMIDAYHIDMREIADQYTAEINNYGKTNKTSSPKKAKSKTQASRR